MVCLILHRLSREYIVMSLFVQRCTLPPIYALPFDTPIQFFDQRLPLLSSPALLSLHRTLHRVAFLFLQLQTSFQTRVKRSRLFSDGPTDGWTAGQTLI